MNKLKEKQERRSFLLGEMDGLFKKVEARGTDFTEKETEEYNSWDNEVDTIDNELPSLKKQEARQKEIALEKASSKEEARKVTEAATGKAPEAKVKNDHLKSDEARNAKFFRMVQGHVQGDSVTNEEGRKGLIEGGHYDDLLFKPNGERREGFNTLTDGKGGILVPTSISNEIMTIAQDFGVVPKYANSFGNILQSSVKVPQVLGRPSFTAVGQGQAISGSTFNLGGIELKAHKWGTIVDWTNEVDESVGSRLIPIINAQLGEAFAEAQDDVFFNADGTSTYNGVEGLAGLAGSNAAVQQTTAANGNVSFATLDAEDFLLPVRSVTPGARAGGIFVMHPNLLFTLMELQDTQGQYIYGAPSAVRPVATLWGYPVVTSEKFTYTDAVSTTMCAFFNPKYLAYATGRNLTFKMLDQGTITNSDSSSINLATTDAQALRVTGLFDLALSTVTRTTASTAQGAFATMRTAAS